MTINQAVSSCRAIIDHAIGSQVLQVIILSFFVLVPLIKVLTSVIKTISKIRKLQANCSTDLPSKLKKLIKKHNLPPSLFAISCENTYLAVSFGLVSKKIFFSRKLISNVTQKELEAILLHELHHTRFFHSLILFIAETFTATFFFIPFLKDIVIIIRTEFEKSADMAAVKYQKTTKYVKKSLKKVILSENSFGIFPQFSYQIIDQRLDNLNNKKSKLKFSFRRLLTSLVVLGLFIVSFILNTKYAVAASMEERITCGFVDCVQNCVATELFPTKAPMTEVNFSMERF